MVSNQAAVFVSSAAFQGGIMKPQISVLIPVYNAEKYLAKCLECCCGQTFTEYEIICVDDGSTDKSLAILQDYAKQDTRLRILSQKNTGVAATRNRLLKEARGKYIAFVDADDWVEPTYLEKLYQAAEQCQADVVRCLFVAYDNRTQEYIPCDKRYRDYAANRPEPITEKQRFEAGLTDSQVWGKLILKDLLTREKIGFCTGYIAEDVSFEILLYQCAKHILFFDEYLYFYNIGVTNSLTTQKISMARGILRNLCFLSDDLANRGIDLPEVYDALLKLLVKGIRRFRNKAVSEEEDDLFQKTITLIDKHKARCYCFYRWKYSLFVRLTRGKAVREVLCWSRWFR